jgi:hypothetical protein
VAVGQISFWPHLTKKPSPLRANEYSRPQNRKLHPLAWKS